MCALVALPLRVLASVCQQVTTSRIELCMRGCFVDEKHFDYLVVMGVIEEIAWEIGS